MYLFCAFYSRHYLSLINMVSSYFYNLILFYATMDSPVFLNNMLQGTFERPIRVKCISHVVWFIHFGQKRHPANPICIQLKITFFVLSFQKKKIRRYIS